MSGQTGKSTRFEQQKCTEPKFPAVLASQNAARHYSSHGYDLQKGASELMSPREQNTEIKTDLPVTLLEPLSEELTGLVFVEEPKSQCKDWISGRLLVVG